MDLGGMRMRGASDADMIPPIPGNQSFWDLDKPLFSRSSLLSPPPFSRPAINKFHSKCVKNRYRNEGTVVKKRLGDNQACNIDSRPNNHVDSKCIPKDTVNCVKEVDSRLPSPLTSKYCGLSCKS